MPPFECEHYHSLPDVLKCTFVNETADCQIDEGFVNYLKFSICQFEARLIPLPLTILGVWLVFLLAALGVTADNYFCPALTVISHTLKLSQNIAGVTFLAFGNGAPDIFSAVAAISAAKNGDAGLAVGALFGAGIFVTTIVAGAISFTRPFKMVERPFLRDVIFYLAAAFWTFKVLYVGEIYLWEAVGFVVLYAVYVAVVLIGRKIYQRQKRGRSTDNSAPSSQITSGLESNGTGSSVNAHENDVSSGYNIQANVASSIMDGVGSGYNIQANVANGLGATESLFAGVILGGNDPIIEIQKEDEGSHPLLEFCKSINPIDTDGWSQMGYIAKLYEIFKAPIVFLLTLTIPVVDYAEEKHNWNRLLNTSCISAPVFCVMMVEVGMTDIVGSFQVWELVLCIGVVLAIVVFFTSKFDKQPVYHPLFSYGGFIVAVLWIYSIANEIVNLLEMYGVVFEVSNEVLGLTVLAWGNSIGDMIADVTMAKQGFPKMALSACFGGPLFNMLLGIGISCIKASRKTGHFPLNHNDVQYVLAGGLAASLIFSLVFMLVRKFHVGKLYSLLLLIIYVAFLVLALLTDLNVIPI
ncbi:putative sodium/potassium/calcium exchanger 6, mitochondrial-like [Apostichopus japonicus]|uniref:Putative sodium/potassium/calcium exchanger 6, mitochondrial-like n=1 Tax=Stichopus japonicus TaxID=307972 RepID=A0A2G8K9H6_STIJA|nr:putative sodium/potassium/calcium exchanger 6, mitochondrial-like [Apostichopus japonicus]